jgi:toxin YoeB
MKIIFSERSWEDYLYWQKIDRKILKKINELLRDIKREPFDGIGKPEPLKYEYSGLWSRRINDEHRLVYKVYEDAVSVVSCRYHYD